MYVQEAPTLRSLNDELDRDQLLAAYEAPAEVVERRRYMHWDRLRRHQPPADLTTEQWWLRTKLSRSDGFRRLPLRTVDGKPFVYTVPRFVERQLHLIDQRAGGAITMDEVVTSDRDSQRRFLVNSLEEEAIRSSQLEGAMTTRAAAKEMLRSGRSPRDTGERMILNNYEALQFMREEIGDTLTSEAVLELHRIVTRGTLDPEDAGRLQRPGERRVWVEYRETDREPLHRPPAAEQLPERLEALCSFANEGEEDEEFVHPVLRAILVHFMLAYDHPFVDGNGRTARILFTWVMLRRGFWLTEYLALSRLIANARGQYNRALLETETDGGDTTYFLVNQLKMLGRAIDDLHAYLRRKTAEQRDGKRLLDDVADLNGRQVVLLNHALKHPDHAYTFGGHARSNRVTHETARSDLGALAERGLLDRQRQGRSYVFEPPPDLLARLKESGADD